jgi:Flp pilus assembly protein TadG
VIGRRSAGGRHTRTSTPRRGVRGQSLVEFALVIPIILLLVVGFFEIGRAVFAYNTIANAARQAVRVAAVNQVPDLTGCDQTRPVDDPNDPHWSLRGCAIAAAAPLGITTANVAVQYEPPPATNLTCSPTIHIGCIAAVTVTYDYTISTPFVSLLIGPISMSQTSEMPVERVFP